MINLRCRGMNTSPHVFKDNICLGYLLGGWVYDEGNDKVPRFFKSGKLEANVLAASLFLISGLGLWHFTIKSSTLYIPIDPYILPIHQKR